MAASAGPHVGRSGGHALVSQRPGGSPLSACPRGTCRGHLRVSTGHYGAGHHSRGRSHHVPDLFGVSLRCSALVCGAGMSTRRTTLSSRAGGAPRLTGGVTAPDKAILKGCLVREVWSRRPPRTLCFRSLGSCSRGHAGRSRSYGDGRAQAEAGLELHPPGPRS